MAGRDTRVALLCLDPLPEKQGDFRPFNYSVRKVQAAVEINPALHARTEVFDSGSKDVDEYVRRVEAMDPDVIGVSAYVWSFPTFVEVSRRLKERRPQRTVIFGGPSARMEMFALPPFRDGPRFVDALVLGEGEEVFQEILALEDRSRANLQGVNGLAVSTGEGWHVTPEHVLPVLDTLASPFQLGLVPDNKTAHLETFRGCPLSCTFCQWGDLSKANRVFSVEYLVREMRSYKALGLRSAMIVDAALNLNARAFRNLRAAEREVGFFREAQLNAEIYPQYLTDEHIQFLREVGGGVNLGLGLQSYDKDVLTSVERPFDAERFERVVADLLPVAPRAAIEIIMGLPGDSPRSFRRTLERAMGLGASVRVFRCLVLPNALMSRSPASFAMVYDPVTLSMQSCLGWSPGEIDAMSAELNRLTQSIDGAWLHNDGNGWYFPSNSEMEERFGGAKRGVEEQGTVTLRPPPSAGPPPPVAASAGPPVLSNTVERRVSHATDREGIVAGKTPPDPVRALFSRWGVKAGRVLMGWTVGSVELRDQGTVACVSCSRGSTSVRVRFRCAGVEPRFARVGGIDVAHDAVDPALNAEVRSLLTLIVAWLKKHDAGAALGQLLAAASPHTLGPQPSVPPDRTPARGVPDASPPREFPDVSRFAEALLSIEAFRSAAGVTTVPVDAPSSDLVDLEGRLREELQRFDDRIAQTVHAEWKALAREDLLFDGATPPELAMPQDYAAAVAAAATLERMVPDGGRGRGLDDMYLDAIPRQWLRQLAVRSFPNVRLLHTPFDWERLPRLCRMIERLYAETERAGGSTSAYFGAPTARDFFASVRTIAELYDGSYWGHFMPLQDLSPTEATAIGRFLEDSTAPEPVADRYLSAPLFHDLSHGRRARLALFPPNLDECVTAYLGVHAAPNLMLPEPGEENGLQVIGWYAQVGQALARVVGWERLVRAYTGVESWSAVLSPALSRAIVRLGWDDYFHHRHPSFQPRVHRPDAWLKLFFLSGAGFDLEAFDMARLEALPWTDIPAGAPAPLDGEIVRDGLRAMCVNHFLDGAWLRVGRRVPHRPIEVDLATCRMSTESGPNTADPVPPAYLFPPAIAARLRADGVAALSIVLLDLAAIPEVAANVVEGRAGHHPTFAIELHPRPVVPPRSVAADRTVRAPSARPSPAVIDAPLLTPNSFVQVFDVDVDDLQRFPNGLDDIRQERLQGLLIRNVMPADFCAEVVARLERKEIEFLELSFQKTYGAQLLGRPVDMSDPSLTQYFRESHEFRASCKRLFQGGPDYEERIEEVCRRIGGGRSVHVPPARAPDEGSYISSTIRVLPPGGKIGVHCGNEAMYRVTYHHLNTIIENVDQISFFLTLNAPEGGGELTIFSLRHDQIDSTMMNKEGNRCYVDDVIDRYQQVAVRPRTGDLLIFDGGRYFHLVSPVQGAKTRWTIGGFIGFGRDEKSLYYWS